MKKMIVLVLLICIQSLIFAGGGREDWNLGISLRGNGNLVTLEKPLSSFESINISGRATVNFYQSQDYRAVVTVDSNLEEYVRVYTQNGILNIGTHMGRAYLFTQYIVDVYCPSISGVSISGYASFEGRDKIIAPSFRLNISGFGKINGDFECDDFTTNISGAGEINANVVSNSLSAGVSGSAKMILAGSCKDMEITISGAGDINGRELQTNNAAIRISGAGNIHIYVLENLSARVSGSGRIKYRGNPKIDFRGSGSGRVESE